jgi:hypothetical protein
MPKGDTWMNKLVLLRTVTVASGMNDLTKEAKSCT